MTSQSSLNDTPTAVLYVDRISVPPVDQRNRVFTAVFLILCFLVFGTLFDYFMSDYLLLVDNHAGEVHFGRSVRDLVLILITLLAAATSLFYAFWLTVRRIVITVTSSPKTSEVFRQL